MTFIGWFPFFLCFPLVDFMDGWIYYGYSGVQNSSFRYWRDGDGLAERISNETSLTV